MIVRARQQLRHQLIFLLVAAALAFALGSLLGFQPRLRFSFDMLLKGCLLGLLCLTSTVILQSIIAFFSRSFRQSLLTVSRSYQEMNNFSVLGSAVTAGAGEELLFRGVVFTWLASFGLLWGLLGHFVLMFVLHFQGRSFIIWSLIKSLECTLYAIVFNFHRGIVVVAVAHAIVELASGLLLRDKRVEALLERKSLAQVY